MNIYKYIIGLAIWGEWSLSRNLNKIPSNTGIGTGVLSGGERVLPYIDYTVCAAVQDMVFRPFSLEQGV